MTPESTLRTDPQTGPEMPSDDPPDLDLRTLWQNKALFDVLLTIAELKEEASIDWIRPPTQSQEYLILLIYYRFYTGYKPRS